jgi:hypothetical protein
MQYGFFFRLRATFFSLFFFAPAPSALRAGLCRIHSLSVRYVTPSGCAILGPLASGAPLCSCCLSRSPTATSYFTSTVRSSIQYKPVPYVRPKRQREPKESLVSPKPRERDASYQYVSGVPFVGTRHAAHAMVHTRHSHWATRRGTWLRGALCGEMRRGGLRTCLSCLSSLPRRHRSRRESASTCWSTSSSSCE